MSEIKELFHEIAADPGPPMPSSAVMLAQARRTERRYRRRVAAGGAVAAVLAVAAAISVVPSWARTGTPTEPAFERGGPAVAASSAEPSVAPVADAADVLDAIETVLPDRFTIRRGEQGDYVRTDDGRESADKRPAGSRVFGAGAVVYDGARAGEMSVHVLDLRTADDPAKRAAAPPTSFCHTRPAGTCKEITVDGVSVWIDSNYRYPDHPTVRCAYAERSAPGLHLTINICQGVTTFFPQPAPPALTAPIFTDEQLAALAADKIFLG